MEVFLGMIATFGFNFAPRGWMYCNGQLLSIAQNSALFSLLGTTYGGDGVTTFGLPDLRGRIPVGGQPGNPGPGLNPIQMGEVSGLQQVTLISGNLPAHAHTLSANAKIGVNNNAGDAAKPNGSALAGSSGNSYSENGVVGGQFLTPSISGSTDFTGTSLPISILNPYLGINYCIATEGIFPSRN